MAAADGAPGTTRVRIRSLVGGQRLRAGLILQHQWQPYDVTPEQLKAVTEDKWLSVMPARVEELDLPMPATYDDAVAQNEKIRDQHRELGDELHRVRARLAELEAALAPAEVLPPSAPVAPVAPVEAPPEPPAPPAPVEAPAPPPAPVSKKGK